MPSADDPYLTTPEIADEYRVARETVHRWIVAGVPVNGERVYLKALKVGGHFRIRRSQLDNFLSAFNAEVAAGA